MNFRAGEGSDRVYFRRGRVVTRWTLGGEGGDMVNFRRGRVVTGCTLGGGGW